jgi:hypothetical protein
VSWTLADLRAAVARGSLHTYSEVENLLRVAARDARRGKLHPAMLAHLLRARPGLLSSVAAGQLAFPERLPTVEVRARRVPSPARRAEDADVRALLAFLTAKYEAAYRDDDAAKVWLARVLPPPPARRRPPRAKRGSSDSPPAPLNPERRRRPNKGGRDCPIPDVELVDAHNLFAFYVVDVQQSVADLLHGRRLPSDRDTRTRLTRLSGRGDATLLQRCRRRRRMLRNLAASLKTKDPELRKVGLIERVLTEPAAAAQDLAVQALRERARGYDLERGMDRALTDARKQDREDARAYRGRRRHERDFLLGTAARVVDPTGALAARTKDLRAAVAAIGAALAACRPRAA